MNEPGGAPMISDADLLAAVQDIDCPKRGGQGCNDFCDHGSCSHTYLRELRAVVRLAVQKATIDPETVDRIWTSVSNRHAPRQTARPARLEFAAAVAAEIRRALCGGET